MNIMRTSSVVIFLLLALHFLLCGVYGARVGKISMKLTTTSSQLSKLDNKNFAKKDGQNSRLVKTLDDKQIIAVECKDNEDYCSSSKGNNRKLITSPTMPTSVAKHIHENLDKKMSINKDDKAQKLSSSSSSSIYPPPSSIHRNPLMAFEVDKRNAIVSPQYESAMDMTVMDYSPAKRRPPIHN